MTTPGSACTCGSGGNASHGWKRIVARPHWLSPPGRTSTPRLVVCFDTETSTVQDGVDEVLRLRCWDAIVRARGGGGDGGSATRSVAGEDPAALADLLEACADQAGEAWALAHNLGFDLAVTSLPMVLADRGWQVKFMNLGDETCVFVLERDRAKLVLTDSWAWLRSPLAQAARDAGMRSLPMPAEQASLAAWHRRCAHDVAILDRLVAELMGWWDGRDLGAFAVTGAGCGWRSLRKITPPRSVLVGSDGDRTTFEREAIYSGRKEVYRVGQVQRSWVADFDLVNAHLTTVAHLPLPTEPVRSDLATLLLDPLDPPEGLGAIARVDITTDRPCAPCRIGDDIWWPVGHFNTILSTPELAGVVEAAEGVTVRERRWYRLTDALQAWGRWCLRLLDTEADDVPAVVRRVAKGWGRSVPGRFALRTSTLIGTRPATHLGWSVTQGIDLDTGHQLETITHGGTEYTYRRDQDGADVAPAVLAFIEGYVRAAMEAIIATRNGPRLLQCNTDGWWEVLSNAQVAAPDIAAPWPYRVRLASKQRGATIIGPNHVTGPGERRLAGVPRDAGEDGAGGFTWRDWPGLRWQLANSRPGEYRRPRRGLRLADHYCRRWVLDDGRTVPVQVEIDGSGANRLVPWARTASRPADAVLAAHQVPALAALAGDARPVAP